MSGNSFAGMQGSRKGISLHLSLTVKKRKIMLNNLFLVKPKENKCWKGVQSEMHWLLKSLKKRFMKLRKFDGNLAVYTC